MIFLENGYVQDGLKLFVYLIPLCYLLFRRKELGLRYFWLFSVGLSLLFLGNLLDFADEFEFLRKMDLIKNYELLQDFLEDIVGFTLGFVVFVSAIYLEFCKKALKKEDKHAV